MAIRIPSQIHVETRNTLAITAKELQQDIFKILEPYIGKKIIKYSPYKGWIAKINDQISNLQEKYREQSIFFRFEFASCLVHVEVNTYYTSPTNSHDSNYVKTWFTVCELDGDKMKDFITSYNPKNYNFAEIKETIEKITTLENEIIELRSKIAQFT
jgi:hypothetical protein